MKLEKKLLIMIIVISILLHKNLIRKFCLKISASKNYIANFIEKTDFDNKLKKLNIKIASNKTKHVIVENELKKFQIFDSSLFIGQSYFNIDGV